MELDTFVLKLLDTCPRDPQTLYEIVFKCEVLNWTRDVFNKTVDDLIESGRAGCLAFKDPESRREDLILFKVGIPYREVKGERLYAIKRGS